VTVTIRAICDGCGKRRSLCVPTADGWLLCPDCALDDMTHAEADADLTDEDALAMDDDLALHVARDEGRGTR
jgi:hypothetical protein